MGECLQVLSANINSQTVLLLYTQKSEHKLNIPSMNSSNDPNTMNFSYKHNLALAWWCWQKPKQHSLEFKQITNLILPTTKNKTTKSNAVKPIKLHKSSMDGGRSGTSSLLHIYMLQKTKRSAKTYGGDKHMAILDQLSFFCFGWFLSATHLLHCQVSV